MKNILSENMQRFGTKNLSESNIEKLNEQKLTPYKAAEKWIYAVKGAFTDEAKAWHAVSSISTPEEFGLFNKEIKRMSGYNFQQWFLGDFSPMTDDYDKIVNHLQNVADVDVSNKSTFARWQSAFAKDIGIKKDTRGTGYTGDVSGRGSFKVDKQDL